MTSKRAYVDGFVLPVPRAKLEEYRAMAQMCGAIWKEHGALDYVECVADDVQSGEVTSFPQSVHLKEDEVVIFAWASYESREHRDAVNEKVMNDPRLADMKPETMPFDGKRMFWDGFKPLIQL